MISRTIRFRVQQAGNREREANGRLMEPAGREHATLLYEQMRVTLGKPAPPWEEEGYAWEFTGKYAGVWLRFITGAYEDQMMVQVSACSPVAWMFKKRSEQAVSEAAALAASILRADPQIGNVVVLTEEDVKREVETAQDERHKV